MGRRKRRLSSLQVILAAAHGLSVTNNSYRRNRATQQREKELRQQRINKEKRQISLDRQRLEKNRLDIEYKKLRNQYLREKLNAPPKEEGAGLLVKKCQNPHCGDIWPHVTKGGCLTCGGELKKIALS